MFFLFILVILTILGIAIYTSRIGVEIENLQIDTQKPKGQKINKESRIYIYLLIFNKIKLYKKDIRNMDKQNIKFQNKDIDIKFFKDRDIKIDYKQLLEKIDIYFEKIDLNLQLSTEDAALTAILTGIISASFGIILKKPKYEVIPIFSNKNFLKIKLDCIFSVHLMQYIYKLMSNKIKDLGKENLNKKGKSGITIIPISRVCFGFAAGGSEFSGETLKEYNKKDKDEEIEYKLPFGGGAGAGISIHPVAFLVIEGNNVKLMSVDHESCIDKLLDYVPDLIQKMNDMFNKNLKQKEVRTNKIINEMRNRNSYTTTNKPKSEEVRGQEQKVADNEKMAMNNEEDRFAEADGEI